MQLFVLGCVVSLVVYLGQFLLLLQAVSSQGCREVSGEQLEFLGLVKKTGLVKGDLGLGCGCLHERRRNCRLGSDLGQCSVPDFSPMTAVEVNARECDPSVSVSITFSALYYNFKMLLLPELEKIDQEWQPSKQLPTQRGLKQISSCADNWLYQRVKNP